MFAYCLNNPTNRIDITGTVSLWYYLFVDSDYGFVHRAVQFHILHRYGNNFTTELTLGELGRADIVGVSTGTVWEVKHASTNPIQRAIIAQAQAKGYIGGIHGDVQITGLGKAQAFNGFFHIQCRDYLYIVNYYTPLDGAILYSVQEVPNNGEKAFAVYVPKEDKITSTNQVAAALIVAGLVMSACGGGNWQPAKQYSPVPSMY